MFFRSAVGALCAGLIASSAGAAERIEFMFPAPVQGKLSREMQKLVKEFNSSQDGVEVVGVFTGSYDDTKVKSQAAAEAGKPPAVVLMSANFATELAMNDLIVPMKELAGDTDLDGLMQEFWPAVRPNAYPLLQQGTFRRSRHHKGSGNLGRVGRCREETDKAGRRALGHHDAVQLRL